MSKLDAKKIIQALPQDYYVVDTKTLKIVESNNPEVKINETYCYKHLYGLNKPCTKEIAEIECTCKKILKEKCKVEIEKKVNTPNGFKAYKVIANPIFDDNGKLTHFLSQYIDIEKEFELKERIEGQNKELKMQNEEYEAANEELQEQKEEYESLYEELKEANLAIEKFRLVLENMQLIGVMLDTEGNITFANDYLLKLTGWKREEVIGKDWFSTFLPGNVRDYVYNFFIQAIAEKDMSVSYTNDIITKKGQHRIIQWNNTLHFDDKGNVFSVTSIGEDITERKKAEQHLKSIEWLLKPKAKKQKSYIPPYGDLSKLNKEGLILKSVGKKTLTDIVDDYLNLLETSAAVYEKNGDYALGIFSSGWCQFLDSASRKLSDGQNNLEALNSGKWLCHESCWADSSKYAIEEKKPIDIECNGSIRLFAIPIFANKEVIGAICLGYGDPPTNEDVLSELVERNKVTIGDLRKRAKEYESRPQFIIDIAKERLETSARLIGEIVERKLAEKALKQSEEKYRRLTENAKDMIYRMSLPDGKYEFISSAAIEMVGYTPADYYENPKLFEKIIHPDWRSYFEVQWDNLLKGHMPPTYEYQVVTKSGEVKWLNQRNLLIKDNDGNPIAIEGIVSDITEKKISEIALRNSEQKLRNITEHSTNLFYQHTTDHQITYISPQVKDILGYTVDEAMVKWTELVTDDPINEEGLKKTMKAIETGEVQPPYELEIRHKSGRKIWVEVREAPLIENRKVIGIVGALVDITEQKTVQDALKESEERYRKLFESANVGIGISTVNGEILAANNAMTRIFGYSNKELLSIDIRNIYSDANDRKILLETVKKEGEVQNMQIQMKPKSGKVLWVSISIQPLDINKDNRLLFVISDITREKEAELALFNQIKKFRTYIETSPVPIFIANEKSQYVYVNEAACLMLGYTFEQLTKMSIPDIVKYDSNQEKLKSFKKIQETGFIKGLEVKLKNKNGKIIDVNLSAVKLSNNQSIAFCTDVTQLKNYERKLKETNEEYLALNEELEENLERIQKINNELKLAKEKAEESDRLKSAFLANMSHEIRTPLNGILGFSALLRKKEISKESHERYSTIIESSGKRLLSVVNDVFDISLIQADQLKIENTDFELNDLMEEIFTFYKTVQNEKLNIVNFKLIRETKESVMLFNDKYRVHQVFKNLLDNAFKFTKEGSVEFGYLSAKDDEITCFVKDTGIGIPKEHLETIFNAFRQVDDSITRDYEGAGLGLSISHGLVERMGGRIWVESKKGKGSTFYFTLPLRISKKINKKEEKIKHGKTFLKNKMILIVEDDLVSFEFLKIFLENKGGGGIIQSSNGIDAINIVKTNKIDIIFMDIRLPNIDGYETTRRIRKFNKKVKIIAQTAYTQQNNRKKSIVAGCDDYLTKPLKEKELMLILEKHFIK